MALMLWPEWVNLCRWWLCTFCLLLRCLQVHVQLLAYSELGDEFKDIVQEYAAVKVGLFSSAAAAAAAAAAIIINIVMLPIHALASTALTPRLRCCQHQVLNSQQAEFVLAARTHAAIFACGR
jgi:ABC-type dipeptide/oligopeptide/nickel transport system permease component